MMYGNASSQNLIVGRGNTDILVLFLKQSRGYFDFESGHVLRYQHCSISFRKSICVS